MFTSTHEIQKDLEASFIVDFLQSMMRIEITNPVSRRGKALLVSLSDHTMVRIVAPKVPQDTLPPKQTEARIHNLGTWRYVTEHDYGYGEDRKELNRLELHNMDECRTYVEDAITTQLNADLINDLITFRNGGNKFMLSIEKQ